MPGAANPGAKALTVIASLLAGRDYIDHVNVLRAGRSTYDAGLVERTWVREVVMPQPDNVAIARKFHEAWTERDPEGGAALIAADCEFYDVARGEPPRGPEGYKRDYNRWLAAFPDGQCEVTHVVDGGEWVVVEFTNRGTNTGSITTALGEFPPTGRRIEVPYCSIMRIKDRKVVAGRDYYDVSTILRQLGLVAESARAAH